MGYKMEVMKVLLWKHAVVRKRRFIHTAVEILSPLILFIILFCVRGFLVAPEIERHRQQRVHNTEPYRLFDSDPLGGQSIARVLFTPDTPLTNQLMTEVGKELGLENKNGIAIDHIARGYWPVNNSYEMRGFTEEMRFNEAIVLFEDLEGALPKKFKYTIRMKEGYLTGITEPLDGTRGPHERFGTIYEQFMKLQWALDKSYLKMLTGNSINQEVILQEFPCVRPSTENDAIEFVIQIVQVFCWTSLLLPFVFLVCRLLDERCSGIQELIKMVGVSPNILGICHYINTLPSVVVFAVVVTILLKSSSQALIPHSSAVVIIITLLLHFTSVVAMAFAASYISNTMNYSTTIAMIAHMVLWLPTRVTYQLKKKTFLLYACGIFPYTPVYWVWDEIGGQEAYGTGLMLDDIFSRHHKNSTPVVYAWLMMILHTVFFSFLAWYLAKVRPGPHGVALPWNFLFERQYWVGQKVEPEDLADEVMTPRCEEYFENPPTDLEIGIKICNVSKVFGSWNGPKTRALTSLSLDIYKGEITVLLGHNGAGKTTLMSIITGMTSATEGKVFVNGVDSSSNMELVRRNLGFCPQHNVSFPDLTVREHIEFFAMLKGLPYKEAKLSASQLMSRLKLDGKENNKSMELSGGMKRRLQLACALAGDASVLVLDEPTSGLDVETRRELWDLLLGLRGNHTVLLSTHFMEEADALGDRVAAIHEGRLRCRATPMYLKRAIGTGYRLTLTLNKNSKESDITEHIVRTVPGAAKSDQTYSNLTYKLPAKSSKQFPKLFNELEENRARLGIETIGVGVTTLEEVFLK